MMGTIYMGMVDGMYCKGNYLRKATIKKWNGFTMITLLRKNRSESIE